MSGARSARARPPLQPRRAAGSQPVGPMVVVSMIAGALAALLLVVAPFVRPRESEVLGAVLFGFALGWALLAALSTRFTDQPQLWAVAPAVFLGLSGLLLMLFGSPVQAALNWLWPPVMLGLVIWMFFRVRRRLRSRSRYWLLYPILALLALTALGAGYETVREAADAREHPAPGRLIDIGGHRLHLDCRGSGDPTVVLEPGSGGTSAQFGWIAPVVAKDSRVCVYDRAGHGWSEPADTRQDARRIAVDLHTLLHRGGESGPYVLAGHSFGGLYVQTFAALYPDDVAGLVLIDSTAPASTPETGEASDGEQDADDDLGKRATALLSMTARFGVARLLVQLDFDGLPPRSRDAARATGATATEFRSSIDEHVQAGRSARAAALLDSFGDKPLIVLTAGRGSSPGWGGEQDAMATLSTNSAHRVVAGATHQELLTDREDAAETTQAIRDVVASARSGARLAP
jgi:pimeloyl-ACP methyl ester carboxylesterase